MLLRAADLAQHVLEAGPVEIAKIIVEGGIIADFPAQGRVVHGHAQRGRLQIKNLARNHALQGPLDHAHGARLLGIDGAVARDTQALDFARIGAR